MWIASPRVLLKRFCALLLWLFAVLWLQNTVELLRQAEF
jgi:hypothetical protein